MDEDRLIRALAMHAALVASPALQLGSAFQGLADQYEDYLRDAANGDPLGTGEVNRYRAKKRIHHTVGGKPVEFDAAGDRLRGVDPMVLRKVKEVVRRDPDFLKS